MLATLVSAAALLVPVVPPSSVGMLTFATDPCLPGDERRLFLPDEHLAHIDATFIERTSMFVGQQLLPAAKQQVLPLLRICDVVRLPARRGCFVRVLCAGRVLALEPTSETGGLSTVTCGAHGDQYLDDLEEDLCLDLEAEIFELHARCCAVQAELSALQPAARAGARRWARDEPMEEPSLDEGPGHRLGASWSRPREQFDAPLERLLAGRVAVLRRCAEAAGGAECGGAEAGHEAEDEAEDEAGVLACFSGLWDEPCPLARRLQLLSFVGGDWLTAEWRFMACQTGSLPGRLSVVHEALQEHGRRLEAELQLARLGRRGASAGAESGERAAEGKADL